MFRFFIVAMISMFAWNPVRYNVILSNSPAMATEVKEVCVPPAALVALEPAPPPPPQAANDTTKAVMGRTSANRSHRDLAKAAARLND